MPIPLGILAVAGAGAAGGAYDWLETTVLGTATATVTFSGLGSYSNYKHLEIRITGRSNAANDVVTNVNINFNSDTGSNYANHWLNGSGSTVTSAAQTSQTRIQLIDLIPGNNNTTGIFGAGVISILDFSNTNKNTTVRSLQGAHAAGEQDITLESGLWNSTAAITSVALNCNTGDFLAGSRFSLYGVK